MPKEFDYILFDANDEFELPIDIMSSLQDLGDRFNRPYKSISNSFKDKNIIEIDGICIERVPINEEDYDD